MAQTKLIVQGSVRLWFFSLQSVHVHLRLRLHLHSYSFSPPPPLPRQQLRHLGDLHALRGEKVHPGVLDRDDVRGGVLLEAHQSGPRAEKHGLDELVEVAGRQ